MRAWPLLLCGLALMLAACEGTERPDPAATDEIRVDSYLAGQPDPGFARAIEAREFRFPQDHGPHPAFATEWWYLTGNLYDPDGRRFGYQLTLFRIGLKPGEETSESSWRTRQIYMGHFAISDLQARQHHSAERFSRAAAGLAGARHDPLRVWLGPWSIRAQGPDSFPLRLSVDTPRLALDLHVERGGRPLLLQGEAGLSRKSSAPGNASYYYSMSRLPSRGTIRIADQAFSVAGNSWLDREWSSSALGPDQAGWDWFALQLDDGRDLMFYRMRDRLGNAQRFSSGILLHQDGSSTPLSLADVDLRPTRYWRAADGVRYPVAWQMSLAAHDLDLSIEAAFDAQEMRHTVRYWEGAVNVSGSHSGVGYLELSGYASVR